MSPQSSGQQLRAPTSPLFSSAQHESSLSDGHINRSASRKIDNDQEHNIDARDNLRADLAQNELPQRRQRPKSSGGFLLQTLPADTEYLRPHSSAEAGMSENAKGKRKVEEGDLIVPKRASALHRHRQKASLGSSPLATEVSNIRSPDQIDGSSPRKTTIHSNGKQRITSSRTNSNMSPASSLSTDDAHQRKSSTLGHDTDPAQIVNLALNLSESRRRNFSSGGLIPPRDSIGAKRMVSAGYSPLGLSYSAAGGSLRHHLNQQRQISRNVSPRSGRSASSRGASPQLSQHARVKNNDPVLPDLNAGANEKANLDASDATLARAEKARLAIELSYEYRRLLQWLPKLPTPSQSRPSTSRRATKSHGQPAETLGRAYNPLQYVRNRKVRFKQDRPLDAETQGWADIDSVRDWVTTVANEREDGISRVDRRFPLPPFDPSQRGLAILDNVAAPGMPQPPTKKISRPHTVWEFTPWDMLADAYWLNQDDNLAHLEDSHGRKLIAKNEILQEHDPRPSKDSVRDSARRSDSMIRMNGSTEKIRASMESLRNHSKLRGRRRNETYEPQSPLSDDNGSRSRKSRWPRNFVRSRSPSSSGGSPENKRLKREPEASHYNSRDDYDSAALEKHMMDILAKEAEDVNAYTESANGFAANDIESAHRVNEGVKRNGNIFHATRRPSRPQRLHTDSPVAEKHQASARASFDEERFHHHRMSSDDLNSTAPNSPTESGFIPSIAINLSPPTSPPTSAASPKKTIPDRLGSFRRARPSLGKRAISENDFAIDSGTSTDVSRQTTNESQLVNMLRKEHSDQPSNGLLSPSKSEFFGKGSRPLANSSIRSIKDTSDSRLRGLFKGGRIAELVGSEVSKVGDLLWKKDGGSNASQLNSPIASSYASEDSDVDDGDISGLDNSPEDNLSRTFSHADGRPRLSQGSTASEKPKFHIENLPSFRSTIDRSEAPKGNEPTLEPRPDHITRQQMALRERGRSSRFDRLAPPKIDMRDISPSPSRPSSPERGKDTSRHSSSSTSGRRVRSADRRLNAMLNVPGKVGTGSLAPTGLSALASRQSQSRGRPTLDNKRQWSISDRGVSELRGAINKRDIARVRALLLSSGVKANEIVRRAEEMPSMPPPFLQGLQPLFHDGVPHTPRSQEHIVAGRMLISNIETTTQDLRVAAERFAHSTVEDLHERMKAVEEYVDHKLTPLVRAAADDADNCSTELTTTHTLAVKQLNDSVDVILRKRRRRLRWIRRVGWAALEWTLLTVMWLVWFIVVIIRLLRGIIRGSVASVRWLFWL